MFVVCPHCQGGIFIEEINCRIFRHAVYKETNEPICPHAPQEECVRLVESGKVYGCGKPFRLDEKDKPVECGYI